MDLKDFRDGFLSLSIVLIFFSLTFIICSILLKPYINLDIIDLSYINIICIINIIFGLYFFIEAMRIYKVFRLYDKHPIKFGKRIGIITFFYSPHLMFLLSLFFRNLPEIEILMVILLTFVETCLIGLNFKEAYDLIFMENEMRKSKLDEYRKKYIEKRERDTI